MYKKLLVSVLLTTTLLAGCGPKSSEDKQAANSDQIDTVMPQDQTTPATPSDNGNMAPNVNTAEPTQVPPSVTPDVKTPPAADPTVGTPNIGDSSNKNPLEVNPAGKTDAAKNLDPNNAVKGQNDLHQDLNKALNKGADAAGLSGASSANGQQQAGE
jgi:PBP1b-binding outer membrane lipoprotein LpoB